MKSFYVIKYNVVFPQNIFSVYRENRIITFATMISDFCNKWKNKVFKHIRIHMFRSDESVRLDACSPLHTHARSINNTHYSSRTGGSKSRPQNITAQLHNRRGASASGAWWETHSTLRLEPEPHPVKSAISTR